MKKKEYLEKAYNNKEFLNSPDARTIRLLAEYYEPMSRLKKNGIKQTVVFFGSARILSVKDAKANLKKIKAEESKKKRANQKNIIQAEAKLKMAHYYDDAVELAKKLTEWTLSNKFEKKFHVCSGGGPGIMEAANKGAKLAKGDSVGFNISLPFEQFVNKYIKPENAFEFHYFFMRKFWFVYLARAIAVFPGGFGTMDEFSEILTLVQTGKISKDLKIIVYDEEYWKDIINFDGLVKWGMICKEDLKLFKFCNSVDEAFEEIKNHFIKIWGKEK